MSCFRACGLAVSLVLFVFVSGVVKGLDVWHFLIEQPPGCAHEPLPGNQSGVKVLVAGLAKCGTRTICHALNEIGVNAYHSEDAVNGMLRLSLQLCTVGMDRLASVAALSLRQFLVEHLRVAAAELAWAMKSDKDLTAQLMRKTLGQQRFSTACRCHGRRTVTWAFGLQRISSCRMEAIAFDGLEARRRDGHRESSRKGLRSSSPNFSHLSGEVLIDTIWESSSDAKAVVCNEMLAWVVLV
ncbi:ACC1 [Symbiodinium sp. CCMP2592]|nr:ACC1 [Symbiodinium sp. CCMP2592]